MYRLDTETQIFFYENEFYIFSNYSSFALEWKGELYPSSEHAYHSEKFDSKELKELIRNARSAHDSQKLAQANKQKQKGNWNEIKLVVMKEILHAKVTQHPYVKKKLLESGDKELVEDSWRDDFWGWGENKDGENRLGKLWMEVRKEVREAEFQKP
jgi:N-glycosidase YbiA